VIDVRDELAAALAGRYDIERELGSGGMAIVYLARDVRHDRHVAVKALRPELATSLGAERFLREINIAARLTHPNILALHDSGNAGGMLYYVMPHVEGETLRDRLDREHQLPVAEALEITRQVGLALDYAHEHGVVHRDIKPENILLVGDHVLVADFGLARALYHAGTERLTESAVAVGTPAYMSPEQAAADPEIDGRTDIYSLACILFEMIAGVPPFKGATAAALLAQHLTAKPPSICAQRPNCPPSIDAAVARALEKTPADRFRTAREFMAALTASPAIASPAQDTPRVAKAGWWAPRKRLIVGSLGAMAVTVVAAVALAKGRHIGSAAPKPVVDASSYVVLPFTAADSTVRADTAAIARRVADALGEWDAVHVVGAREVDDRLGETRRGGPLRLDDALEIAGRLGAAKLVWGEVGTDPADSAGARIARLTLYDVGTGRASPPVVMPYGARGPSAADVRLSASRLLRGRDEHPWAGRATVEHPSLPAWRAYDLGRDALARWDVAEAARQFRTAVSIDPSHAQANLWLSLAELWLLAPADQWRTAARRAYELRDHLDPGDTALAAAQVALAEARYPDACTAYRGVAATDTTGVIGWYGLGECKSRDSLVVRDAASPSGWRFRSSMNAAIRAYMHIVDDRTPPQPAFVYWRLSQLLFTSGVQLWPGHSDGPNRVEFGAFEALDGDTLVLVPYPLNDSRAAIGPPSAAARARAIEHNHDVLRRLYRAWAADAPPTVDAHATLARLLESLEELGGADPSPVSALGQIRRARSLSVDPAERLVLARTELRLLVKTGEWGRVAALADSLFAANPDPESDTTGALAGAAALTGRIRTLATILRTRRTAASYALTAPNGMPIEVPPALEQDANEMFAWALSGACVDSLRGYRARIERQLASYIPDPDRRAAARGALLRGPLSLAVPCVGASALAGVDPGGNRMVMLEQALAARDVPTFRAVYGALAAARALHRPGDTAMDYTYMESWMLSALGDTAAAVAHLDQSLDALPTLGVYLLDYPSQSAGLARAMGLRAELAAAAGDRATAARWGSAVATLWGNADTELQPYVRRLRASGDGAGRAAER